MHSVQCEYTMVFMWRSEDNFFEYDLSIHLSVASGGSNSGG